MSNLNVIRKPEDLAGELARRDLEWEKWESEIVQLIVDDLQPLLLANYPGGGWFRISYSEVDGRGRHDQWSGVRSAFGKDLKRLFASLDALYNRDDWQLRGEYSEYNSAVSFYFRPLKESGGIMDRFGSVSIKAGASISRISPQWPARPSHERPNLRGLESAVSGVVLKPWASDGSSRQPSIYEHFC